MPVYVITARVRSTRKGNIYTWECLSVHIAGRGVPHPRSWEGGTPSQVWVGRVPHLRSRWVPWPGLDDGGYPGYPPRLEMGYPPRPGMGYPLLRPGMGYPPHLEWGTPPDMGQGTPPQTGQHSEHLLRGGRYASCVNAGGLSCELVK